MSLSVGVETPADLALPALDALQPEHELPDRTPGVALRGNEDERIAIGVEMRLQDALLELGSGLVKVHRRPRKIAADVLTAEHRMEEAEIARLVRPEGQPRRPGGEGGSEHPRTIAGPMRQVGASLI